jgi:DNA-binding transcriptional LysR family regulator
MTAAAAISGMGVALMPRLLVEDELARGLLVEACTSVTHGDRAYYLVWPDRQQESAALQRFRSWLLAQARSGPPHRPQG